MSSLPIDSLMLAFWSPGPAEMLVLAVVALLLYGGNLPEVARSWGKSFAEFRRGLSGIQNDLSDVIYSNPEQITYDNKSYDNKSYDDKNGNDKNYDDKNDNNSYDENCRDDAYVADGYTEPDSYQEESSANPDECTGKGSTESTAENSGEITADVSSELNDGELEDSEQTVGGSSADTVVLANTNVDAKAKADEKPADGKPTD